MAFNLLITGGLGYIGSSLITCLTNDITVIDNLHTQRYCSLFNHSSKFTFIEKDFNDITISDLQPFDYVIHLAAIVDAANSEQQKDLVQRVNTQDTIAFLYKCNQAGIKIIFPSSTSVYGTSNEIVYEDDLSALKPQSVYAESKMIVENSIRKIEALDYIILRLGTVCGISSGMRFQTCINKFCYQAVFQQPLTVWKQNLDLVRPYLSLFDLKYAIEFLLNNWSRCNKQTYNVVTDNVSLKDIIEKIRLHYGNIDIDYTDCPLLNQFSYDVSTTKIEGVGVKLDGNIANDIKQTINLLRN